MKKSLIILIFFMVLPSLLIAQTSEDKRRVEEDKRDSLRPSEVSSRTKALPPPGPHLEPIDLAYLAELPTRRITFGYDACKLLVILMAVENEYINLDSQISFLKEKKLFPQELESKFDPMQPLRKGIAAYMFCKALGIKGGVFLRLFGTSPRYCLKELVFQGMMSSGNVKDIVSGEELILTFMQATDYLLAKTSKEIKLK